jgi:hypothetical protein
MTDFKKNKKMEDDLEQLRKLRTESAELLYRLQQAGEDRTPRNLLPPPREKPPNLSPKKRFHQPNSPSSSKRSPTRRDISSTPINTKRSPTRREIPSSLPSNFPFTPQRYELAIQQDISKRVRPHLTPDRFFPVKT